MTKSVTLLLALILAVSPVLASTGDDIAFLRSQVKLLEDTSIDASEMRASLAQLEADETAYRAKAGRDAPTSAPVDTTSATLQGSWSHPAKGTWNFQINGRGTLVRDSVNGVPGRYTITVTWSVEPGNILVYSPIRNTLLGSPDSDRDEPIANPKTYRAPFEVHSGVLVLGGANYIRQ